jgi:hypothetical protein
LKNECSSDDSFVKIESHAKPNGANDNPGKPDTSESHPRPQIKNAKPTATFELRATSENKIEGNYYAEQAGEEKSNWSHKFICDTKIGEFSIAVFTLFLVIFTGGLWWSTARLWTAGERQLAAAQRPWVKVDSIGPVGPLVFENGEGRVDLRVVVSNKGNSPGLRVRVDVKLVASNQINLLQEQQAFAAAHRRAAAPNELRPELTSWPAGDTISFGVTAWLSSIDMPRFKPLADNTPFPVTLLAIVGCVTYEFSFSDGFHQTGLIYDLHRAPSGNAPASPVVGAVPLEGTIPQHELNIGLNFAGTGPID